MDASITSNETDSGRATNARDQFISLGQAGQIAPGRPSANAVWRWCRKGVLSRSGERVKLQHVRAGGKLFTTSEWVNEFGQRLAAADAAHFDKTECAEKEAATVASSRRRELEQIDRELKEAGL